MSIAAPSVPVAVAAADETSVAVPGRMRLRERLFAPVDNASLVFFRIFFGGMMLFHVYKMCRSGWIDQLYMLPSMNFTYPGFGWVRPWPGQGMYYHFYVMGVAAAGIMLGCCYRLSALVFALGMAYAFLLEKAFYLNHYYLMILLSGLLVVVPAHQSLSVDAWLFPKLRSPLAPAWALRLIQLQLAIPYFYGGLAKLESDWLLGYPLKMWLKRGGDHAVLAPLFKAVWAPLVFSWGGMLFDLLVVPLIVWKPTRIPTLIVAIGFHVINSQLFEIGIFPWLMMGATLLFFEPDFPRRWLRLPSISSETWAAYKPPAIARQNWIVAGLSVYVAWQLLLPFRAFLYPGPAMWTEEGHHFAWHMMLREKDVGIRFYLRDPKTGQGGVADVKTFLTERQMSRMSKDADMILTFVHHLRDHFRAHGQGDLQIRVLALVSLNGRKPQLMLDPSYDYAKVERTWWPQPWILPLTEPLREEPWTAPLQDWELLVAVPGPAEMLKPATRP